MEAWAVSAAPDVVPRDPPPGGGLDFLGTFTVKGTVSPITTENPLLAGMVVGELGGANTTVVGDTPGVTTEQRAVGILRYSPPLWSGRATLTAGFEIDFGWGDQSYGIGGNTGGAYGADQVNLQTRRLHGRFALTDGIHATVGLQFVSDGALDPEAVRLDDLARTGGRLMFFGSEAAGLSVYGRTAPLDWRLGGYTLYEIGAAEPDDVTLWMGDTRWRPAYATHLGLHAWYLRDRAGGSGGVLGTGPTSVLSEMQGGPSWDFRESEADPAPEVNAALGWIVADAGYNHALDRGDLGVTGVAAVNVGRLYVKALEDQDITGFTADLEARWRYAMGAGSVVRAEVLYTSQGVVTGNSYGIAGANQVTHSCLLLFPDLLSINRQVAVVYDISGGGEGVAGVTGSVGWDPVPNRLTLQAGAGHALDRASELNFRVVGRPLPLLTLGAYGAVLLGTDGWIAYTALDWIVL